MYSFIIKEDKNNLASTKLCVVCYSDRKFITRVTLIYWSGALYGTVVLMHTCTSSFQIPGWFRCIFDEFFCL